MSVKIYLIGSHTIDNRSRSSYFYGRMKYENYEDVNGSFQGYIDHIHITTCCSLSLFSVRILEQREALSGVNV